jgi:cysteine dioxygenase
VLTGVGTETKFEFTPCGLIKAVSSKDVRMGEIVASQDADIHQVSNLQPAGTDLITLHIYSPPLLRMDTYSLTDGSIKEYTPIIHEYTMGGGI